MGQFFQSGAPSGSIPVGVILPFGGTTAPDSSWLFCYGQAISRATYSALFDAIGTNFGTGDGSSTFNLPDLRGRVPAGKDDMGGSAANRVTNGGSGITGTTMGAAGGTETHTLTSAQMPSHGHTQDAHTHTQNSHTHTLTTRNGDGTDNNARSGDNLSADFSTTSASTTATNQNTTATNQNTGGGGAHLNMQPTQIMTYIIKATA